MGNIRHGTLPAINWEERQAGESSCHYRHTVQCVNFFSSHDGDALLMNGNNEEAGTAAAFEQVEN